MVLDLDDVLAFQTPKVVIIRDRWLGMLKWTSLICACVYFSLFELWRDQGYMHLRREWGYSTFKLLEPATLPLDKDLNYCSDYIGAAPAASQYGCKTLPYEYIMQGSTPQALHVTTYYYQKYTNVSCLHGAQNGDGLEACEEKGERFFVRGAETYSLRLYHVIKGGSSDVMDGYLRVGDEARLLPKSLSGDGLTYDELPILDLLAVAGVDMNEDSQRETGIGLEMTVEYKHDWQGVFTHYEYSLKHAHGSARYQTLDGAPFDEWQINGLMNGHARVVKRGGLRIHLVVVGEAGNGIEISALLRSFVSSLGLLAVTNTVVTFLMKWVMPHRAIYRMAKMEQTPNLAAYKAGCPRATAAMEYLTAHANLTSGRSGSAGHLEHQLDRLQKLHLSLAPKVGGTIPCSMSNTLNEPPLDGVGDIESQSKVQVQSVGDVENSSKEFDLHLNEATSGASCGLVPWKSEPPVHIKKFEETVTNSSLLRLVWTRNAL